MKIHNFKKNLEDDLVKVSATVTWEDCDRPQREIYIGTDASFENDLSCNPNAFLLAAVIPGWYHGERRIMVDGTICPQLRNGLITALGLLTHWYKIRLDDSLTFEATQGFLPSLPSSPERVASFMSGGVDALTTLRTNRMDFPLDHPYSIQDCFHVHGIDIGGYEALDKKKENFKLSAESLSDLAKSAKITLIPVYMNLRYLDDSDYLFALMSHGAVISGIAHAFSTRGTTSLIPSSYSIGDLAPWGSHPLLDSFYSSTFVSIRHDGLRYSRIEKVGLIADWREALQILRSCYNPFRPDDGLNCGKCEKCLRTMTELLVYGKLDQCKSFPLDDISPELVQSMRVDMPDKGLADWENGSMPLVLTHGSLDYWQELIDPLHKIGRLDLAQAIKAKLKEYERYQARIKLRDRAKQIDRKYLCGILSRLNRLRKGICVRCTN